MRGEVPYMWDAARAHAELRENLSMVDVPLLSISTLLWYEFSADFDIDDGPKTYLDVDCPHSSYPIEGCDKKKCRDKKRNEEECYTKYYECLVGPE